MKRKSINNFNLILWIGKDGYGIKDSEVWVALPLQAPSRQPETIAVGSDDETQAVEPMRLLQEACGEEK